MNLDYFESHFDSEYGPGDEFVEEDEEIGEDLEEIRDVHGQAEVSDLLAILTYYEKRFMGEGVPINYLKFSLGAKSAK